MKTTTAALVLAAAFGTLCAAPALAEPCANCHEPNDKDKDKAPLKFSDGTTLTDKDREALIAFLNQPDNPPAPKDPPPATQGSQSCANCHTSKSDPFNKPQPQFYAWAPTAQPKSPPCNYNCHTPNGAAREQDFGLPSSFLRAPEMDEKALRAWLGQPDGPGNPATALVDQDSDPKTPPKDKPDAPKPTPKGQTTPAQHKVAAKPKVVAAKPQLDAAASDDDGDAHFDGADGDKPATKADDGVDAKSSKTKKSPAGEAYPKPKGVSTKIADVPKPAGDPAKAEPSKPAAAAGAPASGGDGMGTDANVLAGTGMGGGAGIAIGALAAGPLGAAIGMGIGALLGGLLGGLLSLF